MTDTSRFISLILRHKPETIDISLDQHGWANVDELIAGIAKTHNLWNIKANGFPELVGSFYYSIYLK